MVKGLCSNATFCSFLVVLVVVVERRQLNYADIMVDVVDSLLWQKGRSLLVFLWTETIALKWYRSNAAFCYFNGYCRAKQKLFHLKGLVVTQPFLFSLWLWYSEDRNYCI